MDISSRLHAFQSLPFHSCSSHAPYSFSEFLLGPLSLAILSACCWTALHVFVSRYLESAFLKKELRSTWHCKLVSGLHALLASYGSLVGVRSLQQVQPQAQVPPQLPTAGDVPWVPICAHTPSAEWFLSVTAGYMIYDFVVSYRTYGWSGFPSLLAHHLNIAFVFSVALWGRIGYWIMAAFMTNEISTPFMHITWLGLKTHAYRQRWFQASFTALLLTFLGGRFGWNSYVIFKMFESLFAYPSQLGIGLSLFALVHAFLNYYWCFQLFKQIFQERKQQQQQQRQQPKKAD